MKPPEDVLNQGECAGAAKTGHRWRPLPIGPMLMSSLAKASGTAGRPSMTRRASAELPAPSQPASLVAGPAAGPAACEEAQPPAEHGLKRRRHSDESPRMSTKQQAAGPLFQAPEASVAASQASAQHLRPVLGVVPSRPKHEARANPALLGLPQRRPPVQGEPAECKTPAPTRQV